MKLVIFIILKKYISLQIKIKFINCMFIYHVSVIYVCYLFTYFYYFNNKFLKTINFILKFLFFIIIVK